MAAITPKYSINAESMKKSQIREILKLTQQPDIISFGGGLARPRDFSGRRTARSLRARLRQARRPGAPVRHHRRRQGPKGSPPGL